MTIKNRPFLVYGTLRPGFGNYEWALKGLTVTEENLRVRGLRMYTPHVGFPYVGWGEQADAITGTLVTVSDDIFEDVLDSLDSLEGYRGEGDPGNLYDREIIRITRDETDEEIYAYVYLVGPRMRARLAGAPYYPEGDWERFSQRIRLGVGIPEVSA